MFHPLWKGQDLKYMTLTLCPEIYKWLEHLECLLCCENDKLQAEGVNLSNLTEAIKWTKHDKSLENILKDLVTFGDSNNKGEFI